MAQRTLGAVLREARTAAAMSQSALARTADVSANHISRIESGERVEIGFAAVARIALALGLSLDDVAAEIGLWPAKGRRLDPIVSSSTIILEELRRVVRALNGALARVGEAERVVTGRARLVAGPPKRTSAKKSRPRR